MLGSAPAEAGTGVSRSLEQSRDAGGAARPRPGALRPSSAPPANGDVPGTRSRLPASQDSATRLTASPPRSESQEEAGRPFLPVLVGTTQNVPGHFQMLPQDTATPA